VYELGPVSFKFFTGHSVIHGVFGLKEREHLKQWTTCLEVAGRRVSADVLIELVRQLYRSVGDKLGNRKPSAENWRWKPQIRIQDRNMSPEPPGKSISGRRFLTTDSGRESLLSGDGAPATVS
jgi:hypothetical protein